MLNYRGGNGTQDQSSSSIEMDKYQDDVSNGPGFFLDFAG